MDKRRHKLGKRTPRGEFWCWKQRGSKEATVSIYKPFRFRMGLSPSDTFMCDEEVELCSTAFKHVMDLRKLPPRHVAWHLRLVVKGVMVLDELKLEDAEPWEKED